MAYQKLEDLPQDAQKLPQGAQQIFMAAFNSAQSDGMSEQGAAQVAWNSVKNQYEQGADGQWQHRPDAKSDHSPIGNMSQG